MLRVNPIQGSRFFCAIRQEKSVGLFFSVFWNANIMNIMTDTKSTTVSLVIDRSEIGS